MHSRPAVFLWLNVLTLLAVAVLSRLLVFHQSRISLAILCIYTNSTAQTQCTSHNTDSTSTPNQLRHYLRCHGVVPSLTTLATMRCQSALLSEALMICVGLTLSFHDAHKLSRYFSLQRPSLSSPLAFQSPPNFQGHAFSRHAPCKQADVDEFFSLEYDVLLPILVLGRYFSSQSMMSLAFSTRTKLPLPSICPSISKLSDISRR